MNNSKKKVNKLGQISDTLKYQVFKTISDPQIKTWKQYIKDGHMHAWNILVEAFDNGIDAGAKNMKARFNMFPNKNIKMLNIFDDGDGISRNDVYERFTEFPLTKFQYKKNSIGANGYGIKGIAMRIGGLSKLITKLKEESLYRLYEFYFLDSDGVKYKPNELLKLSLDSDTFFKYKFVHDDIIGIEITETILTNSEVEQYSSDLASLSSGTYIEIEGNEDNELEVTADTQYIITKYVQAFYGLMDVNISIGFNTDEYLEIKPIRFPISDKGYPSAFNLIPKFEDIKTSKNEYYGHIFYTYSDKHQDIEMEAYHSNVLPFERVIPYINGSSVKKDGQYIWIYNEQKRLIGIYRLNENGVHHGNNNYNHLNIILVAKTKIRNLDRMKFQGFSSGKEILEIRKTIKNILDTDKEGVFLSPTWDLAKQEEISQTQELVSYIQEGHKKYKDRVQKYIFDELTITPKNKDIEDTSKWIITNNIKEGNQIDIECFKVLWEIENKTSVSSKDHLEKINLWYDEIIQMANLEYEWIVWVAKSHSFEKRLKLLLKNKPCTNPHFKGIILINWKDFYREDVRENKVKYIRVEGL